MIRQFSRACQRRCIAASPLKMADLSVWLGVLAALLFLAYFATSRKHSYWRDRGVRFVRPLPLFGSLFLIVTERLHFALYMQRIYRQFRDEPFTGMFLMGSRAALLVRDPELIKHILVKDFSYFCDRPVTLDEKVNPLQAKSLLFMKGERWREMRQSLTPTFTSGRIKAMYPIIQQCARNLENHLASIVDSGTEIDIKELLARYTTDVIGNCAFGIECDSINDPNCKFRVMGRTHLTPSTIVGMKRRICLSMPKLASVLRVEFVQKDVAAFFHSLASDVVAMRARTGETRRDFMQLLIELKDKGRLEPEDGAKQDGGHHEPPAKRLTDEDIAAQATVFFNAGFETSSSTLAFGMLEMARQPELQRRARRQIEEVLKRHGGELTYDALHEMTYLDWVIKEALRMYPPAVTIARNCNKQYLLPGTDVTIDPGTCILIPIYAMQNDPKYFANPTHFDPEHFNEENQSTSTAYVYMPFGEGPRHCIGLRFARVQSKLALVALLRRFDVRPSARTKYPLTFDTRQFLLSSREDIILTMTLLQKD